MASSSRNLAEWAREIYGRSFPGVMLDYDAIITPSMLPRPSLDLMLSLQIKEAILASHRNQDQCPIATSAHLGHPAQAIHQTSHEAPSMPTKQMPIAWANITPPTDPDSKDLNFFSTTSEPRLTNLSYLSDDEGSDVPYTVSRASSPHPIDAGYVADDEDSDISYIASDLDSDSDISQTRATPTINKGDEWVTNPNLGSVLEQLERQVSRNLQRYQGRIGYDCFPAIYKSLDEEQKRRNFFWRFGPAAYEKRYLQSNYMGNIVSKSAN